MLQFSRIFMTPGTWNFTKIIPFSFLKFSWKFSKIRNFNFLEFSWLPVHENSQKSDASVFLNFHDLRSLRPAYLTFWKCFWWKSVKLWTSNWIELIQILSSNSENPADWKPLCSSFWQIFCHWSIANGAKFPSVIESVLQSSKESLICNGTTWVKNWRRLLKTVFP